MVKIQVILLLGSMNALSFREQENILDVVREEYCRVFSVTRDNVNADLFDGASDMKNKFDVVLNLSGNDRILNEGRLQDEFRKRVSDRLWKIFPARMSFSGRVGIKNDLSLDVPKSSVGNNQNSADEKSASTTYPAQDPRENFERVQLPQETIYDIDRACNRIKFEREVFDEWGLYAIMPNPICALNFFGPPGTGKTLAADALANKLGKKIIRASYADIESKYHGEGPKNVQAIFKAASEQDAVLFIDEADSLLSKRLTEVTQGSEQAINSMRSQILICLENFHGIVIFATNLVVNYDRAFASRLTSVEFKLPDEEMREKIWRVHLLPTENAKVQLKIPLAADVDFSALAKDYVLTGRAIRNVVVEACVEARSKNMPELTNAVLVAAIKNELEREKKLAEAKDHTKMNSGETPLTSFLQKKIADAPTYKLTDAENNSSD